MKQLFRAIFRNQLYNSAYSRAFFTLYGVIAKEVSVSFRQFFTWHYPVRSLFRVWAIIGSSLIRIFLGRSLKYSFAHTGEDRVIESLLKPLISQNGYYVDVGCNHPVFLSNTYSLYRKGWRGLCVDANPVIAKKYKYLRPKDKFIQALVSDDSNDREFYMVQNDVLSSTEKANAELAKQQGLAINVAKYKPQTLTSILNLNKVPFEFDLLSVDAEEHDYNVLKSLDFSRYKPKLIIVEDETFDILKATSNSIVELMKSNSYLLVGYVLKNLYFSRNMSQ